MPTLAELMQRGRAVQGSHPWPCVLVDAELWQTAGRLLAEGHWTLLSLWADSGTVHMALLAEPLAGPGILSLECANGKFPSIGKLHPPAARLERTIQDLYGLEAEGASDSRPWLDHGSWGLRHPLGERIISSPASAPAYAFLTAEGEGLHQIAVGPVHAGIIEPGHFRFTANGEAIVRLEERLGYAHKGIDGLMTGADLERAAKLAGRISGDSTVAYALAFSRAAEAALQIEP